MSKVKSKVVFTKASVNDTGVTVTGARLKAAGFRLDPNNLLPGERYKAVLVDNYGATVETTLTCNRSKALGSSNTTLYSSGLTSSKKGFTLPQVGNSVEYTISSLKKVRNRG
jgi:hypothetical protein